MVAMNSLDTARTLLADLIDQGVRDAVLAPGSRSAPFAYALAELEQRRRVRVHIRTDERVAGFTALGLSLATHRPVPVITTSGTAVGELLPAVMEACHAGVRLIVLSADRPEELRGTGANQTTRQDCLFPQHVRASVEIPAEPEDRDTVLSELRTAVGLGAGTRQLPAGPVQVNVCFRDPLVPEDGWSPSAGAPASAGESAVLAAPEETTTADAVAADPLVDVETEPGERAERRTVVLAGHGAGEAAAFFARRHGLPLLAEPSSNARFGPNAIPAYRALLPEFEEQIERVAVFGRPTLSRPVARLMSRRDVERALYEPRPAPWHEPGKRTERLVAHLTELGAFAGYGPAGWLESWQEAGADAEAALQTLLAEEEDSLSGLHVADAVWEASDGNLVIGASNPVRDADLVASPGWHPIDVYANRGLAGIDGTLSTAVGVALGSGIPTRVLLGDLTFLHDAGALLLGPGEAQPDVQAVVLNDAGGRIFGLLEHGRVGSGGEEAAAAVERYFGTPHRADLASLCAGYGAEHRLVESADELFEALDGQAKGLSVVEVRVSAQRAGEMAAAVRELFS